MALGKPDMKILVVDDFPTMRRIIKTLLRQNGYSNFVEAEDGALAYKLLASDPSIEFIVSDWNMPNMTGLEFLKTVRADAKYKHLPFLMVTAEAEKEKKAAEKARKLAEAKFKSASAALQAIQDICADDRVSDYEARTKIALIAEANI